MIVTSHHGARPDEHPDRPPAGRHHVGGAPDRRMAPALYALYVAARFFVAAALLLYASSKVFGTQLDYSPITADTPASVLSGFELMWQFYGWSRGMVAFVVVTQVVAAVLLVVPRTTRLGYMLTIAMMGNIVVMDVFYGIDGGLQAALAVLGGALVLLLIDLRPMLRFLFAAPMVPTRAKPRPAARLGWVRFVALPVIAAGAFGLSGTVARLPEIAPTELHGSWQNEADDHLVRLHVDARQSCAVRDRDTLLDRPRQGMCTVDPVRDRLTVDIADPAGELDLPPFRFAGGYALSADGTRLVLRPDDGSAEIVLTRLDDRERGLGEHLS